MVVADDEPHAAQAPFDQALEEAAVAVGGFAWSDLYGQDLAIALLADADGPQSATLRTAPAQEAFR